MNFPTMTLSYFTGERHSENFEQIIHIAGDLGYSVRIYESKESNQFDFLQAVYRDTATVVDVTIPDNLKLSTVYPLLTAHVNILDHIIVFSDKQYDDGTQILPLNITPQRSRTNKDLLTWLRAQLIDLKEHQYYERFEIESIERLADYNLPMEAVMFASLDLHKPKKGDTKRVMISFRSGLNKDVNELKKREEANERVSITVLPSGFLCDKNEAHTPMRRWMLVGLLDDIIRGMDEVWAYYNDIYAHSWWTLAEMVMVAYINYDRAEEEKVRVRVYESGKKRFIERGEKDYPEYLHVKLSDEQHRRLTRYLSNTRPNTMGPENNGNIKKMKIMSFFMRIFSQKMRKSIIEKMRPMFELMVPNSLPDDERKEMVDGMIEMYSDPNAIVAYANDAVFKDEFWNNISYQTERVTAAFKDGIIDVDTFIDTPMQELTKFKDEDLCAAADSNAQIKMKGNKYYVGEGKKRYLWLATRMGMSTVKDAPGIEIVQTYNLQPTNRL